MSSPITTCGKASPGKRSVMPYIGAVFIILAFGYLVAKDVSLPREVTWPLMFFGLILLVLGSFRSPVVPFYVLVMYLPFNNILTGRFAEGLVGINLTNILTVVVILGWVLQSLRSNKRFLAKNTLNAPIALFCLWGFVSVVQASFSYGQAYSFDEYFILFKRWISPFLLFYVAVNVVKDKETFRKVVFIILTLTVVVGLMAIRDYMNNEDERIGGVFLQPNYLGAYFAYNMFFFAGFFLYNSRSPRYWLLLIPFLICFRGIMVSFSRGAYIASAFGGLMTTFFRSKLLFAFTLAGLAFAVLNPVFMPAGIRYRMATTFGGDEVFTTDVEEVTDISATKRLDIWKGAVEMIKERPLTGFGYGTFTSFIGDYPPGIPNADAHNTYITIAAEMGIPALALFLVILFLAVKNARWLLRHSEDRFFKAFALGYLGGVFALLVVNIFGSRLNSEDVSSYFWVLTGLIMRSVIMKKEGQVT